MTNINSTVAGVPGIISTTSTTYGSLAATLVLASPLIVIPAIRAILFKKKSVKAQPIVNSKPKKKRKAHRGRRHSKKIAEKAKAEVVLEVKKAAEEEQGMSLEMALQLAMRSQMEMSIAHNARKESSRQKGKEKFTKGLPTSKTQAGWRQTEEGEEIGEVGMDGDVGREEVDGDNWTEVVPKRRRKDMAVTPSLSEAATLTETAVSEEASLSEETAVSEEGGLSEKAAVVMEAGVSKKAAVSEEVWFE
jgi:hypothetical protein